jgi:hypothetical protein
MKIFSFITLVLVLASCSDGIKRKPEPDNLIPREQMVETMSELIKLESYIQGKYPSVAQYNKVMINSGDSLLGTLNVTKDQFEASLEYYGSRQDVMKGIYDEILDDMNKELGQLNTEVKDSLK